MNMTTNASSPLPQPCWLGSRFPTFARPIRWLFSRRVLQGLLFAIACLATLVALFYTEENWRGKRAWNQFRRQLEARGEHLDVAALLPKPVPDDQNFAMTPLLASLFDYTIELVPSDPLEPVRKVYRTVRWRDTNAYQRAQSIGVAPGKYWNDMPGLGSWTIGERIDLNAWQSFYRSNAIFSMPSQPLSAPADVLAALSRFDGEFAELRVASQRPYAQFKLRYDEGIYTFLPQWSVLYSLAQTLRLRVAAELALGQIDAALADVRLGFCLVKSLEHELLTLTCSLRDTLVDALCQVVWQGLADHRWSDPQLIQIQALFEQPKLLSGLAEALRGERALGCQSLEQLRRSRQLQTLATMDERLWQELSDAGYEKVLRYMPGGWWYRNELNFCLSFPDRAFHLVDGPAQRANLRQIRKAAVSWEQAWQQWPTNEFKPFWVVAELFAIRSGSVPTVMSTLIRRTALDEAAVACALERYRLAHLKYPESLEVLVPRYLKAVPPDLFTGAPLLYRTLPDNRFVLYSVGLNESDEGGSAAVRRGWRGRPAWQREEGDWVWEYPEMSAASKTTAAHVDDQTTHRANQLPRPPALKSSSGTL